MQNCRKLPGFHSSVGVGGKKKEGQAFILPGGGSGGKGRKRRGLLMKGLVFCEGGKGELCRDALHATLFLKETLRAVVGCLVLHQQRMFPRQRKRKYL